MKFNNNTILQFSLSNKITSNQINNNNNKLFCNQKKLFSTNSILLFPVQTVQTENIHTQETDLPNLASLML